MLNPNAIARIQDLLDTPGRKILGIVGAPGAGKSTLAMQIQTFFGDQVTVVSMDGFHLANTELARLNLSDRKGAPDTFDVHGYIALLKRIVEQDNDELIYAPLFDRNIEEPIASSVMIHPSTKLIVTEGNYLLHQADGWQGVKRLLYQSWYLDIKSELRLHRLINRHIQFGRSPNAAQVWVQDTDEPNTRLIERSKALADWVLEGV